MRILLAIVVCTFLGALAFEGPGAALGFLVGLVTGLIWYSKAREAKQAAAPAVAARPAQRPPTEMELLKARLGAVEERLARLERGSPIGGFAAEGLPVPSVASAAAAAAGTQS